METLDEGVEGKEKRRKGVYEFVKGFKNEVLKIVVADLEENWLVITVVKFSR